MTRHDTHSTETYPTSLTQPPPVLKWLSTTVDTPTSTLQWITLDTTSWHQHSHNWWLPTFSLTTLHPLDACQSQYCTADVVPSYYATTPDVAPPFCASPLMQPCTYMVNPLPSFTSWKIPSYIYYLHFIPRPSFSLLCNEGAIFSYLLFCSSLCSHSCATKIPCSCPSSLLS